MALESVNSERKKNLNFALSIQGKRMIISNYVEKMENILQDVELTVNFVTCKCTL